MTDKPKRKTVGRPKKSHSPGRHNIYLDDDIWEYLTRGGTTSGSFAIELLVRQQPDYRDLPYEQRKRT